MTIACKPITFLHSESVAARFWSYVDKSGGPDACWPWTGGVCTKGYGRFWAAGGNWNANRVAFAIENGIDPGELLTLHECDNPVCCNPVHLFLGDNRANMVDMAAKNRGGQQRTKRGEPAPIRKVSIMDVLYIRTARMHGETVTSVAARFGISIGQVSNIARGKSWGWLWDRAE